jgi:sugar phosphate isomerase/epimerase
MDQARLAECIGATRAGMWILPGCDERAFDENVRFHVERFKPIAELLAASNIRLGLEFIGPLTSRSAKAHEFVHTLEGMVELARAIGPNVGLLLDSWHWHTSGATTSDLAALSAEQIVHVHVNDAPAGVARDEQIDNRRKMPGTTGVIDIAGFLGALERMGYDGPVTAEPFDEDVKQLTPDRRAEWNARCLRDVMGKAGLAESSGT